MLMGLLAFTDCQALVHEREPSSGLEWAAAKRGH